LLVVFFFVLFLTLLMFFMILDFLIITILLLGIWTFEKFPTFPQLNHIRGNFPLYLLVPFLSFFIKLATYSSYISDKYSLGTFSCFFLDFDSLNEVSHFAGLSCPVLISYAVRIPCSSSTVSLSRSGLSSRVEMLPSYLIDNDLKIFWTMGLSLSSSPTALIELTISSTL
jgi:hypothetical protein